MRVLPNYTEDVVGFRSIVQGAEQSCNRYLINFVEYCEKNESSDWPFMDFRLDIY